MKPRNDTMGKQVELLVSADGRHYERFRRIHFDRRRTLWNLDPITWASLTLAMPRRLRPALRLSSAKKRNLLLLRSNGGGNYFCVNGSPMVGLSE